MDTNRRYEAILSEVGEYLNGLLDLIFPPQCLACGSALEIGYLQDEIYGLPVCPKCKEGIFPLKEPFCTLCSTPFRSKVAVSHICGRCTLKRPHFDLLISPFVYEAKIEEIISGFKYGTMGREGKLLGRVLGNFLLQRCALEGDEILIPVPLHPKRERERGFNQTLLMAKGVAHVTGIPIRADLLIRRVYTKSQTGLSLREREQNVKGVFELRRPEEIKGRKILLLDDVATTGSTLNECAKVLKRNGARVVICGVLARARFET